MGLWPHLQRFQSSFNGVVGDSVQTHNLKIDVQYKL